MLYKGGGNKLAAGQPENLLTPQHELFREFEQKCQVFMHEEKKTGLQVHEVVTYHGELQITQLHAA